MSKASELFLCRLANGAKIKLLGDSITHGVGGTGFKQSGEHIVEEFYRNPDGFCWANEFSRLVSERYGAVVTNNACTGTTVEFILKNFTSLVSPEDDIVICTIGTNNRHQYFETGERKSREEMLETFRSNVNLLVDKFCEVGVDVIFVANIPASPRNEKDGENYWRILHMTDINDVYRGVERERGIALISMYELFAKRCEEVGLTVDDLLPDGLHPGDEGYRVMLSLMCEALGI